MAIRIIGMDPAVVRKVIFDKISAQQKKELKDRDIRTWTVRGSATDFELQFTADNWKDCGHFRLTNEDEKTLRIGLKLAPEHFEKGPQWPTLLGAIHGDLAQLLVNHFHTEILDKEGVTATLTRSWINTPIGK